MKEKSLLQAAIVAACCVPLCAGAAGVLLGADFLGGGEPRLDNHFRYLSGLLLGIGLGFLSLVPHIERHGGRMRLLTGIVVIGGIGRAWGLIAHENPGVSMQLALVMELMVTPLLCLWQARVAKRFG